MARLAGLVAILAGGVGAAALGLGRRDDRFNHAAHAKLFPTCVSCHAGIESSGAPLWPSPESCADCHDGRIEERVTWSPREGPPSSNLRFTHARHQEAAARPAQGGRSPENCLSCHGEAGAASMAVKRSVVAQCLTCHRLTAEHLAAPDSACAVCHLPLAEARTLAAGRIRGFPAPATHQRLGFLRRDGHGTLAAGEGAPRAQPAVAASCATCHARDFCIVCHVDAPEIPAIQALAPDPRSLLHEAKLEPPATHGAADFESTHSREARNAQACVTCHTQESCTACHAAALPAYASRLHPSGAGRSAGGVTERRKPRSHTNDFADRHGGVARSRPTACATCHRRAECLDCHRPAAARGGGYHPAGFVASHPTGAYSRQATCGDCHNAAQFCAGCHRQAGLSIDRQLGTASYHDAKQFFVAGHGQAARQSLESCVSCHTERDCLACHSAAGGRRFNPHGPGFNADRLRRRNPEMCIACHGTAIPGANTSFLRP